MNNTFTLAYGLAGDDRKRLVKAIAEYRETFSEYCGAPTFDYRVDEITIDRKGTVIFPERPADGELQELAAFLKSRGFTLPGGQPDALEDSEDAEEEESGAGSAEVHAEQAEAESTEDSDEQKQEEATEEDILTIEIPREGFTETAIENLRKMVAARASLLKKSLGTDDLTIEVTDEKIRFPWFHETDSFSITAYTKLVTALGRAAKEAKRVTATDHEVESEKYAFRTWLLRLGFIGSEYKDDRAILMKNLSGTAAFKNGADAEEFSRRQKAKRDALKAAAQETLQEETAQAAEAGDQKEEMAWEDQE